MLSRIAIAFILAAALRANHPHITRVRLVPTQSYIEWDTASASDDEQSETKDKSCSVLWKSSIMACGSDERRFDIREGWVVRELVRSFLTFVGLRLHLEFAEHFVDWVEWKPFDGTGVIHIGTKTYEFNSKGEIRVVGEAGEADDAWTALPDDAHFLVNMYSARLVKYCMESTQWWDAGQGEPVDKKRAGDDAAAQ